MYYTDELEWSKFAIDVAVTWCVGSLHAAGRVPYQIAAGDEGLLGYFHLDVNASEYEELINDKAR